MKAQDTLNQLSRRQWLRDTAIAATSVVVVPSMLISCTDHRIPPDVGPGAPADLPTEEELYNAATNIGYMIDWLKELRNDTKGYEGNMYGFLKAGKEPPSGMADFVLDILLDIAVGIVTAAAEAATAGAASALFGVATVLIKEFALPESRKAHDLDEAYAEYEYAHDELNRATRDALYILKDVTTNEPVSYKNLRDRWTQEFDFNGKKYAYRDLATVDFPSTNNGTEWVITQNAAYEQNKKYFWNVMFIKAGKMTYSDDAFLYNSEGDPVSRTNNPTKYAREVLYKTPGNEAGYWRAYYSEIFAQFDFKYWSWTFDGLEISETLAKMLFVTDTPTNIINPDGLFDRDYVFKQFHREKPDFLGFHNLRVNISSVGPLGRDNSCYFLDCPDNYEFTGGILPALIKK